MRSIQICPATQPNNRLYTDRCVGDVVSTANNPCFIIGGEGYTIYCERSESVEPEATPRLDVRENYREGPSLENFFLIFLFFYRSTCIYSHPKQINPHTITSPTHHALVKTQVTLFLLPTQWCSSCFRIHPAFSSQQAMPETFHNFIYWEW